MYFLVSLACALAAGALWFFFRDRKRLHFDILTIVFGSACLMWLVDCFATLIGEGVFLDFSDPQDGWIALYTFLGGLFLWLIISFILNNKEKAVKE